MLRLLWIAVAVATITLSTVARADFESGRHAFNAGDYATAAREFRAEAQRGNANAMFLLGELYVTGRGVPRDDREAASWYFNAVRNGQLGVLYFEGKGVPRDLKASAGWMTRAAKQKFPLAAHYLGDMYLAGAGVEKNEATAVRWYTVAANQANPVSMAVLGGLYKSGRGVQADRIEAFKWLFLAVGRFPQMPQSYQAQNRKIYDGARNALIALKRDLSDDQVAEGQRRAQAFVAALKQRTRLRAE